MEIKHSNNRPAPGLEEAFGSRKEKEGEYDHPGGIFELMADQSADHNYARITREQYADWYKRFYPKQRELMEQSQSGALLKSQLGRVDENFDGASEAASRGKDMQMARYGLSSKDDPNRDAKLALNKVSAKNGLRDHERERSMNTLSGGSMGLRTNQQNQMPR